MKLQLTPIAAAVLAMLALTGCLGTAPVKQEPVIVYKQVAINCIKSAPVRPAYKTESLLADASDFAYADALADDWLSSRTYEGQMEAAVNACLIVKP
jgi:hypothetical protein